jgi:hypothetical protein
VLECRVLSHMPRRLLRCRRRASAGCSACSTSSSKLGAPRTHLLKIANAPFSLQRRPDVRGTGLRHPSHRVGRSTALGSLATTHHHTQTSPAELIRCLLADNMVLQQLAVKVRAHSSSTSKTSLATASKAATPSRQALGILALQEHNRSRMGDYLAVPLIIGTLKSQPLF